MKDYKRIVPLFHNFNTGVWNSNADFLYPDLRSAVYFFLQLNKKESYKLLLNELDFLSADEEYMAAIDNDELRFKYAWGGMAISQEELAQIKCYVEEYIEGSKLKIL